MVIGALLLVGCMGGGLKVVPLEQTVRGFSESLRWERFDAAAEFLKPGTIKENFVENREDMSDELRITHVEVLKLKYGPKGYRAIVTMRYTWHYDREGVVKKTVVRQRWIKTKKLWLLKDERYERGDPEFVTVGNTDNIATSQ